MSLSSPTRRKLLEQARTALRQSVLDAEPSRNLPTLLVLAAGSALALVVLLSAVFWLILTVLAGFDAPDKTRVPAVLTAAISMTALIGASLGAVYAFRKQILTEKDGIRADQQVFSDRYIKGAELLANERPSARLAALHSLANLADDWPNGRSSCAMAICSYLRLPLEDTDSGEPDLGEREVRRTAWKAIRTRLIDPEAATSWHQQEFDFSGGQFDNIDLDRVKLHSVNLQFRTCSFSDGEIRLRGAELRDAVIDFSSASFRNMKIMMTGMRLKGRSSVILDSSQLADCVFESSHMIVDGRSHLHVREADICRSVFKFDNDHLWAFFTQQDSSLIKGEVDFSRSHLQDVKIFMYAYTLNGRLVLDDVATDEVDISLPSKILGVYVNLDVIPQGPTKICIGPGSLKSGDLRIRPGKGTAESLDVDFFDYDIAGGEVLINPDNPTWRHFYFDGAGKRRGSLRIDEWGGGWPDHAEVEIKDFGRAPKNDETSSDEGG